MEKSMALILLAILWQFSNTIVLCVQLMSSMLITSLLVLGTERELFGKFLHIKKLLSTVTINMLLLCSITNCKIWLCQVLKTKHLFVGPGKQVNRNVVKKEHIMISFDRFLKWKV